MAKSPQKRKDRYQIVKEQVTSGAFDQEKVDSQLEEKLRALVDELDREARRRVGQRTQLEQRWIADLEAFHNKYDAKTKQNIDDTGGSKVFIGITRTKTNALEARLCDMLFPTDDKNWGIRPTPVPELAGKVFEAERLAKKRAEQATVQSAQGNQVEEERLANEGDAFAAEARHLKSIEEEAKRRCDFMEDEMDDQLREAKYQVACRDAIRDACRIGTGVIKGPMVGTKMRPRWERRARATDGPAGGAEIYDLTPTTDPRPMYYRVNPWNYYPDMDVDTQEESTGDYERHLMNKRMLRRLARQPGFNRKAIERLLEQGPRGGAPQWMADLRGITNTTVDVGKDKYHVWEFHGALEIEQVRLLAQAMMAETGDEKLIKEAGLDDMKIDPLTEMVVNVWFCDNELLKFGIHPLDSGESLYSIFALEKDEATVWGFGVPYLIRDSQKCLNGAWRMLMNNSGLSAGPQIVVNRKVVEPSDGDWRLRPMKTWELKSDAPTNQQPFQTFNIDGHHEELIAVINLAKENIDEEAALPDYAQGEVGAHPENTATGAAILMNSANVVFRRIVRNFDDDMTRPNLRRLYDWNMQHSRKNYLKGDFEVDARGSSVLLVREIHAQNLMVLLFQGSVHPVLGPLTKVPELYRKLVQSLMLPAEDAVKTDEEIQTDLANQPPEPDVEMEKLTVQLQIAQMERETKLMLAQMERDTAMMRLAAEQNLRVEDIRAQMGMKQMEIASGERKLAVETAVEERNLRRGVAAPSGGTISVNQGGKK